MEHLINSFTNKALDGLTKLAGNRVTGSIKAAAEKTGVDFAYLMQQAKAESSFKTDAAAKTSSATGLFQFIESTWMSMVDRYGDKHGIDTSASKDDLLALRNDPTTASAMAAEFAGENKRILEKNWGGETGSTELYFAHFLGAGSASDFLKARDENGSTPAASLFPKAAKANSNVFYDNQTGDSKSLDEVYAYFDKKFSIKGSDMPAADTQLAKLLPPTIEPAPSTPSAPSAVNKTPVIQKAIIPAMSYQALIHQQMDLIMLTQQLDLPLWGKDSTNKLL